VIGNESNGDFSIPDILQEVEDAVDAEIVAYSLTQDFNFFNQR